MGRMGGVRESPHKTPFNVLAKFFVELADRFPSLEVGVGEMSLPMNTPNSAQRCAPINSESHMCHFANYLA